MRAPFLRRSFSCTALALITLSLTPAVVQSQVVAEFESHVAIGVTGAVSANAHTGTFGYFTDGEEDCDCPDFKDGSGVGFQTGIAIRYQASELFALDSRVVFDSRPGEFETHLPDALVILPGAGQIATQSVVAQTTVVYTLATVEILATARFPLADDLLTLAVSAGPTLSTVTKGTLTQSQQLTSPPDARFTNPKGLETEDKGRRLIFNRDLEIPDLNDTRASLKGGVALELGPIASLLFRAGIYYDRGLTGVRTKGDWMVHSTMFQLDALVEL
jgi:hypothetical protein